MKINEPFVSIVTPVYNGEKFLIPCIESVLAQNYRNWEYIIVNNSSTDRTGRIAERYAARDSRIRVVNTPELYPIIKNWNFAMRQIWPRSDYCKVVHADDWLYPECISSMVAVAEQNPDIGLVSSYRLLDTEVAGGGLKTEQANFDGREIMRRTLSSEIFVFGSPSTVLYRSCLARQVQDFYNADFLHADTEACYRILLQWRFGFVHQVLSGTRQHPDSQSEKLPSLKNSLLVEDLGMLLRYGPAVFSETEFQRLLERRLQMHYRHLARRSWRPGASQLLNYHRVRFQAWGLDFSYGLLLKASARELVSKLYAPVKALKQLPAS